MRTAAAALLLCMTAASASAQGYNPHAGDSVAPSPGTVVAPLTPNGVDWLNSQLGLSPSFLAEDGTVNAAYVKVDLSAYVTQTTLNSTLVSYLSISAANKAFLQLAGGTITGDLTVSGDLTVKNEGAIYGSLVTMNGAIDQLWPASTGVLGVNMWASNTDYGRLVIKDTAGGSGGIETGRLELTSLTGTGNAYACLDASGNLYRSSTACQ